MARSSFGGEVYGAVVSPDLTNMGSEGTPRAALAIAPAAAVPLYNAEGGTLQNDFLIWNQATLAYDIAASSVTSTTGGYLPKFQGPDGLTVLWTIGADGTWLRLNAFGAGGDGSGTVTSVNSVTPVSGNVTLAKGDIGLGNVTNTSDANKPVSTAQQAALDLKVSLADLEAEVLAILAGNDFYPALILDADDAEPVTAIEGAAFDRVSGSIAGLSVASVIAEDLAGSTSVTTSGTPSALGAGAVCYALVSTYLSGATSGSPAPQPTGLTGMGLTWTEVTLPVHSTTNGLDSFKLFKGVGTGTATKPVAAFSVAPTRCHIRIAQVVNAAGTTVQATSAAYLASNGTPSISLPSAPGSGSVTLCWIVQNNSTNTQTAGTGFTEIGSAVNGTGIRTSAEYANPAVSPASWTTPTTPTPYQKALIVAEVS